MAHKYCVRQKVDTIHSVRKIRYYAVPVTERIVETYELADEIAHRCALSQGDVRATVSELFASIGDRLGEGCKVRLEGIGLLTISLESRGFETPEECVPSEVRVRRVCFRADQKLKKQLEQIRFERQKE